MRNRIRAAAAAILATAGTACTHLETRPSAEVTSIDPGQSATQGAQTGLSYALPMVQYDLKITRALEECPTAERPWPRFTAKVEATQRYVAGERFEVDYQALSSIMKSTTFNVAYHESGTLKSINSTAKDKTGDVLSDVARIGLAVGSIAMPGVGAPSIYKSTVASRDPVGIPTLRAEGVLACTDEAERAVAELSAATANVKQLTRETAELTQQLTRVVELVGLKLLTEKDRDEWAPIARRLLSTEEQLRAARQGLADAQEKLSATEARSWPNAADAPEAHAGFLHPDETSLQKFQGLLEVRRPDGTNGGAGSLVPCGAANDLRPAKGCIEAVSTLSAALVPLAGSAQRSSVLWGQSVFWDAFFNRAAPQQTQDKKRSGIVKTTDKRWAKGIYVREPVEARLVICLPGGEPRLGGCSAPQTTVLSDKPVVAPQLGRLRLLPFTNGPFEDNSLQLAIRSNGLIETFQYGEESSASRASSSLATIAEKVDTSLEKMETERRDDIKYARDTQAWMRTEAAAIRVEELAKLTYQIDEKNKQLELLKSQAALAGAGASIQMAAEQAKLEAEVKELQSQVAKIKLANELAELAAAKS